MNKARVKWLLQQFIYKRWYLSASQPTLFFRLLSYLYQGFLRVRRYWFSMIDKPGGQNFAPVVVIGNIVVGGTGKTPMVIWLANYCHNHGVQVGIISKGYGRSSTDLQIVETNSLVENVGDEALLIKQRTLVPVVVAKNRLEAIKELNVRFQVQLIISDDGLQDYRMARAIELILYDGHYGYGNGYCLPAGPLREPKSRLQQADFILEKVASNQALKLNQFCLAPKQWISLNNQDTQSLFYFKQKTVHAVTGIAHSELFFKSLEILGIKIIRHAYSDHYAFVASDFLFNDNLFILMTEKDAVKCRSLQLPNAWFLQVEVRIDQAVGDELLNKIVYLQKARQVHSVNFV